MKKLLLVLLLAISTYTPSFAQQKWLSILPPVPTHNFFFTPTTWFVRQGGGTLYNATTKPTGQCDGKADVDYPGSGVNQHCAVSNVQYLYLNGVYGTSSWSSSGFSGGDTLVIRGCAAIPGETNSDAPHCRIGIITNNNDPASSICQGVTAWWGCSMPPPPSGTSGAHTKILGGCAFGTYTCNPITSYPYTSNLTQLFGGFGTSGVIEMQGSSYVDVDGLEITDHSGSCVLHGSPRYPATCSTTSPYDDFAKDGIDFDNTSNHINLTNVYIHGMTELGLGGSHGQGMVFTGVILAFNGYMGWNMDDGVGMTSNATLNQSYMSIIGSSCLEQYPITNPQFPALACWDDTNGGFGDAWSAGTTTMDTFSCDHCYVGYNMKDGLPGPHVETMHYSLTNSIWEANGGQSWKMSQPSGSTGIFTNNLLLGNCYRLEGGGIPPGANAALASHLYLGDACRANAVIVAYNADAGSTVQFGNNTIVTYMKTIWQIGCNTSGNCASLNYNFTNNLYLGYTPSYSTGPVNSGQAPAIYFNNDSPNTINFVGSHNLEYGVRNGDACAGGAGINGNTCQNPLLVSEPAQGSVAPTETALDSFDFHPTSLSPAVANGTTYTGQPSTDFYGSAQTSPLTIGAVVFGTPTAAGPTLSPGDGYSGPATTISITTGTSGCSAYLVYNTTNAQSGGNLTGTTTGTSYSLTATGDLYSQVQSCPGYLNSPISHGHYTVVPQAATPVWTPSSPHTDRAAFSATIAESTGGAIVCWKLSSAPVINGASTCPAGSTLYAGLFTIGSTGNYHAVAGGTGLTDSGDAVADYTITLPALETLTGTDTISGSFTLNH